MNKLRFVLFSALLFWGASAFAGDLRLVTYQSRSGLQSGVELFVADPWAVPQLQDTGSFRIARRNLVRLSYTRDKRSDVGMPGYWEYEVSYKIHHSDSAAGSTVHTIKVSYGQPVSYVYEAQNVHDSYANVTLEVTGVTATYNGVAVGSPHTSTALPVDIRLSLELESAQYEALDANAFLPLGYDALRSEVFWGYVPGAEEYDVEWVHIDTSEAFSYTSDESPFLFRDPVRVRTPWHKYAFEANYPAGTIYFRVRAVGRYIHGVNGDYSHVRTGNWNYRTDVSSAVVKLDLDSSFEGKKNWVYQSGFAEHGMHKGVLNYYDGSGRARQLQTHLSTQDLTLVADSRYDYEGRPSVSIIPAPRRGRSLVYATNFNVENTAGTVSFEKEHYDGGLYKTMASPTPGTGTYGSAQYFSANNIFTEDLYRDYIPEAEEGYAFTQVEYMRDNTGRVSRSSGVGKTHRLFGDHDTRYFYGSTNGVELHRLFGTNVGMANHYKKNMVSDPNGQLSVSYHDQEGRTIATALAGAAPANLDSIPQRKDAITADLSLDNVYYSNNGTLVSQHTFLNAVPQTVYRFKYDLEGAVFGLEVAGRTPVVCLDCRYELEFFITDPQGARVSLMDVWDRVDVIHRSFQNPSSANCASDTYVPSSSGFDVSVMLQDIGSYTVTKSLRIVNDNVEGQLSDVLEELGITYDSLYQTYLSELDTTVCDITCEQHARSWVRERYPTLETANPTLFADSVAAYVSIYCSIDSLGVADPELFDECAGLLQNLTAQVNAPDGRFYLDDAFLEARRTGLNTEFGTAYADVDTLRESWREEYAGYYVQYHREYCHYTICVDLKNKGSQRYDYNMAGTGTWTRAVSTGYFNPLTTPNKDPLVGTVYDVSLSSGVTTYHSGTPPCGGGSVSWSLQQYTDPTNIPCMYVGLDTDTTRWQLFYGAYQYVKQQSLRQYKLSNGCMYYSDGYEVVEEPVIGPDSISVVNQINQNIQQTVNCVVTCEANVQTWINQLYATCFDTLLPVQDSLDLRLALENYCYSVCGFENPYGLIISGAPQTPEWEALSDLLDSFDAGCTLDSLAVTGPYPSCEEVQVDNVAPCTELMFDFINDYVLTNKPTGPGTVCYAVPTGHALERCAGLPVAVYWGYDGFTLAGPCGSGHPGEGCVSMLYADSFTLIDPHELLRISNPVVEAAPFAVSGRYPTDIRIEATLLDGTIIRAYIFRRLSNCPSVSFKETYCVPTGLSDDFIWQPAFNEDSLRQDCIASLYDFAAHQAEQHYNALLDSLRSQILQSYQAQCYQKLKETYTVTYDLREYHYTLYYYDQAGNLVQTVPPKGVDILGSAAFPGGRYDRTTEPAHTYRSLYAHNSLDNVRKQTTPDGGTTHYWYDDIARLRFAQHAEQQPLNYFSYTKYDDLSRPVEVGESGLSPTGGCQSYPNIGAIDINDNSLPAYGWEVSRTLYDQVFSHTVDTSFTGGQQNLRNKVSGVTMENAHTRGTCTQNAQVSKVLGTYYSYDEHGNVKELLQHNGLLEELGQGFKRTVYDYDLITGNVNQVSYQAGQYDAFYHRYSYDADNRLTLAESSRNGELWEQEAKYFYYLHGPLARMETGHDKVQGQDYAYTLQGWLKGMNANRLDPSKEMGKDGTSGLNTYLAGDAYGFSLGYYGEDYKAIGSNGNEFLTDIGTVNSNVPGLELFNGNIRHMGVALSDVDNASLPQQAYLYRYDQLNRIKEMNAWKTATTYSSAVNNNDYQEQFSYDANGNITALMRNGITGVQQAMDNLSYHYTVGTNKLDHVTDAVVSSPYTDDIESQGAGNYDYDAIGNLIKDEAEEIETIEWTPSGKVKRIKRQRRSSLPDMEFWYDAMGQRTVKVVKPRPFGNLSDQSQWEYTHYVRDAQGNVLSVYSQTYVASMVHEGLYESHLKLAEQHVYGSSRIGMSTQETEKVSTFNAVPSSIAGETYLISRNTYSLPDYSAPYLSTGKTERKVGHKRYELTNHLGNVMVTVSDLKLSSSDTTVTYYLPQVISYTDYYAFGSQQPGRYGNTGGYRYGFNGQERDNEIAGEGNSYTAEYWQYDSRLGRRWNIDPVVKPHESPYATFANNPVMFIDPNGNNAKEYKTKEDYLKENPNGKLDGTDGHWLTSDRESNTSVWDRANEYNLRNSKKDQYQAFEQVRDLYYWIDKQIEKQGHDIRWADGAYHLVSKLSLGHYLNMVAPAEQGSFMGLLKELNVAIADFAIEKFGKLLYHESKIYKGEDAYIWDRDLVVIEQRDIAAPVYRRYEYTSALKALEGISYSNAGMFIGIPNFRMFRPSGPIDIVSDWQLRVDIPMLMLYPTFHTPISITGDRFLNNKGKLNSRYLRYMKEFTVPDYNFFTYLIYNR